MHSFRTSNMHTYTYSYMFAIPTQIPIPTCLYMETIEHIYMQPDGSPPESQPARQTNRRDAKTGRCIYRHNGTCTQAPTPTHAHARAHARTRTHTHTHTRKNVKHTNKSCSNTCARNLCVHKQMSSDSNLLLEANIHREPEREREREREKERSRNRDEINGVRDR